MNLRWSKHPRPIRVGHAVIDLLTIHPLPDELAARVAIEAWKELGRPARGRYSFRWTGDAETAALLPPPPRTRG